MKWKNKPYPKTGDEKCVTTFLWLPLTIGLETRWLEKATIKYTFYRRTSMYGESKWMKTKFLKAKQHVPQGN